MSTDDLAYFDAAEAFFAAWTKANESRNNPATSTSFAWNMEARESCWECYLKAVETAALTDLPEPPNPFTDPGAVPAWFAKLKAPGRPTLEKNRARITQAASGCL
jgi:hypothetical protein